ncbi:sensor histidine kinase [Kitasatospora sp. NPDC052896]|uniref:sensor histidine kinase n=1 Tax=Kitasatospora sp. NPDC052896 TaxID=3364061 RepID=UPI0037CC0721
MAGRLRSLGATARRGVRPGAAVVDRALAAVFLAAMLVERVGAAPRIGARMPVAVALSVVVAGALALRRTAPLTSYLVGSAALSAEALFVLPSPVSPYANLVGLYSLGLYATRGRARLAPVIVLLGIAAYFTGAARTYPVIPAGVLFIWLLAWAFGYGTARRQEEREAARRQLRQRVVDAERARIARELHDLVGHTLNVMLVQAGAARRLIDRDPRQTRELLSGMEHTGREALEELDRVLGLLRRGGPASPGAAVADGPSPSGRPPGAESDAAADGPSLQPGLGEVARLVGRMEQAGIRVTARIDPAARRLPRSIDMSAYRIVQEALTNTVKHGRANRAEVTVRRDGDVLDIEVLDDGLGASGGYVPGRGLLGIAERVSMFGGSVEHRGGERGGFRLHAVLPIPC